MGGWLGFAIEFIVVFRLSCILPGAMVEISIVLGAVDRSPTALVRSKNLAL